MKNKAIKERHTNSFSVMDSKTSTTAVSGPQQASNHDELFMQQTLLFSDTLKDLKNLRKQLYSAAEYFEASYSKEEEKQMVVETLKDYAIKALINTVDHLGSVADKLNNFCDEKVGRVSEVELRFSCLEQRLQTCEVYTIQGGLTQQSLLIKTPKHHKRYIIPVDRSKDAIGDAKFKHHRRGFSAENNILDLKDAVQATMQGTRTSLFREGQSAVHSPRFSPKQGTFTFTRPSVNNKPEIRESSPQRFPLRHSESLKGSTSPNHVIARRRYPSQPMRSVSTPMSRPSERGNDIEQYSGKSKRLLKALLSIRKSKRDGTFYKYLDEM